MIVVMMKFASLAPIPSMVTVVIFAAVIAAEAPVVPVASPSALTPLEVLAGERATMMLRECVAGVDAGRAVVTRAGSLSAGDAAGESYKSKGQK